MGKPLQQDEEGRIMGDTETKKTQKAYANYEKDLSNAQKKRDEEGPLEHWTRKLKRTFLGIQPENKAKGGKVSSYKAGGKVSSASKRADGCAIKGKTRGKMV